MATTISMVRPKWVAETIRSREVTVKASAGTIEAKAGHLVFKQADGKTTLIDEFSKQYDCYIKLNLEQSSDAKAFSISDNVAEIFQYICLQKKIVADKSKCTLNRLTLIHFALTYHT